MIVIALAALLVAADEPAPAAPAPAAPPAPTTTAASAAKPRVFVLDLKSATVERRLLQTLEGALSAELARYVELDVLSQEDVRRALEMESSKALIGCDASTQTSCLAEVANAMGAELVVFGDVETVEHAYVMNLGLLDTNRVQSRGRVSVKSRALDKLADKGRRSLRALLGDTYAARGWALPVEEAAPPAPLPIAAYATAGAGAVALAVGGALLGVGLIPVVQHADASSKILAAEDAARAPDGDVSAQLDIARTQQRAQADWRAAYQTWGLACLIAGGVALGAGALLVPAGVVWALLPADE